jgi:hypothetical protein
MSTTRTVPKHVLNHPGFISVISADSSGYFAQHKELVYVTLLAQCGMQETLKVHLDGIANDDVQTIGNMSTSSFLGVSLA